MDFPAQINRESDPVYRPRHEGTALVVGTAFNMMKDFEGAMRARPKATVFGVNRTNQFIDLDHLVSLDRGLIGWWKSLNQREPICHSGQPDATKSKEDYPEVDHWWKGIVGCGTSAWGAARIALFMGFEEVILCGAPLVPGKYADGVIADSFKDMTNIKYMRRIIKLDEWMRPMVVSMSGWTKEFLGGPQ